MTIKNFLKTAVLGIAFCSVFGINGGMASPGISLQDIFDKLSAYHNTDYNNPIDLSLKPQNSQSNLKLDNKNNFPPLQEDLEIDVLAKLLSITEIIEKALKSNVIDNDLSNLIEDINYFEMQDIPQCEYTDDINFIVQHRDTIIEEVQKIIYQ